MTRGPWLMVGLWSAGTAAATTVSWVGAHAVSSAIGATPVPVVPAAPPAPGSYAGTGLGLRTAATSASAGLPTGSVPSPAGSGRAATFSDAGGTLTVRCVGTQRIDLVSASPSDGYRGDVGSDGPNRVSINFLSRDRDYEIDVRCSGGRPVERSTVSQNPTPPPPR